jgi:hypothetical protein
MQPFPSCHDDIIITFGSQGKTKICGGREAPSKLPSLDQEEIIWNVQVRVAFIPWQHALSLLIQGSIPTIDLSCLSSLLAAPAPDVVYVWLAQLEPNISAMRITSESHCISKKLYKSLELLKDSMNE